MVAVGYEMPADKSKSSMKNKNKASKTKEDNSMQMKNTSAKLIAW